MTRPLARPTNTSPGGRCAALVTAFACAACLALLGSAGIAQAADTVTVLTWDAFISPKVIKTLKNREGLDVRLIEFSTEEQRESLLRERGAEIDIVGGDTVISANYKRRGILERLDTTKIPTLKHQMSRWRADPNFAVPYLWGHTGIAWRTDLVKTPPTSYAELFALAAQNPGKVSLLDGQHESLRAALYALGKPPYTMQTPAQVAAAAKLLAPRAANFRIVGSGLDKDSPWVTGAIIAGQAFNGDIAYLRDTFNTPLAFAIPSPGCMIFQEQLMMLKTTKHRDSAYRFLTLINDPGYAARNAFDVRYATPNPLAASKLSKEFREDKIIRPTFDGLDGCYFYSSFDAATQSALDAVKLTAP